MYTLHDAAGALESGGAGRMSLVCTKDVARFGPPGLAPTPFGHGGPPPCRFLSINLGTLPGCEFSSSLLFTALGI